MIYRIAGYFRGWKFREMLDMVVRINFRGSNFRGTRVRAIAIDADDVDGRSSYIM